MKRDSNFYPEDVLADKHQSGEINWVGYIAHHSDEWCDEYESFCKANGFDEDDDAAAQLFVENKNAELEAAIEAGNA